MSASPSSTFRINKMHTFLGGSVFPLKVLFNDPVVVAVGRPHTTTVRTILVCILRRFRERWAGF